MLPKEYIANLKALQGFDYDAYQTALCAPPTRGLHVNLCKGSEGHVPALICEEWQEHALTPLSYSEDCFLVESEKSVGQLPLHHAGAYYMQEPSAMTPVCCLALKKGMRVLDLCAAPGGKSTQIANKIGESGLLVSNEIHPGRCAILAGNIERMGIRHAVVTHTDAQTLAQYLPHYFDAIVVDAPCSGEGMFRKTPEAIEEWQESGPLFCAKRQKEILSHAAKMLKSGGCLVYSTCTFSYPENEGVVADFLDSHPDFSLCEVPDAVKEVTVEGIADSEHPTLRLCRRFYPYHAKGEGQFMALLCHKGEAQTYATTPKKSPKHAPKQTKEQVEEIRCIREFLASTLDEQANESARVSPFKIAYTLLPPSLSEDFPLPDMYIYAKGVKIGEVRKGRVVPYHHYFTAYGSNFKSKLHLNHKNPHVLSYLRGDVIPCDLPSGWGVLMVDGYALGGIKVTDGTAKNHYPTGLRNK